MPRKVWEYKKPKLVVEKKIEELKERTDQHKEAKKLNIENKGTFWNMIKPKICPNVNIRDKVNELHDQLFKKDKVVDTSNDAQ